MDWSKHKFFVGLFGEDDGSIDLMVWMMNRFYYQRRRWTVIDIVVGTTGFGDTVGSAIAVDNGDFDRPHVCKSVPLAVSFSMFSDMDRIASAAAMHRSKHIFY